MDHAGTDEVTAARAATLDDDAYQRWHEKPAGKFVLGFSVFVLAEVLVYGTLHWIFPLI
jgi:heme/copper-type cytochrome/quinol oxidase subunit 3